MSAAKATAIRGGTTTITTSCFLLCFGKSYPCTSPSLPWNNFWDIPLASTKPNCPFSQSYCLLFENNNICNYKGDGTCSNQYGHQGRPLPLLTCCWSLILPLPNYQQRTWHQKCWQARMPPAKCPSARSPPLVKSQSPQTQPDYPPPWQQQQNAPTWHIKSNKFSVLTAPSLPANKSWNIHPLPSKLLYLSLWTCPLTTTYSSARSLTVVSWSLLICFCGRGMLVAWCSRGGEDGLKMNKNKNKNKKGITKAHQHKIGDWEEWFNCLPAMT